MLVDAAIRLMGRNHAATWSVGDVLTDAGLSTRAFYRHFDSKETLVETLMLREADSVARSLALVVADAADPVAAVEAWLARFLDVFFEPRRARRVALLTSAGERTSRLSARMLEEMRRMSCAPLIRALRTGHEDGVLYSPTPEADAYSLYDLVNAARQASDVGLRDRGIMEAHVMRFAWPALGLPTDRV